MAVSSEVQQSAVEMFSTRLSHKSLKKSSMSGSERDCASPARVVGLFIDVPNFSFTAGHRHSSEPNAGSSK